jgi:hypothetical protein
VLGSESVAQKLYPHAHGFSILGDQQIQEPRQVRREDPRRYSPCLQTHPRPPATAPLFAARCPVRGLAPTPVAVPAQPVIRPNRASSIYRFAKRLSSHTAEYVFLRRLRVLRLLLEALLAAPYVPCPMSPATPRDSISTPIGGAHVTSPYQECAALRPDRLERVCAMSARSSTSA